MININSENKTLTTASTSRQAQSTQQNSNALPKEPTQHHSTQQLRIQWAKISSINELNTQQKTQLTVLNPSLSKTLIAQIKGDVQGNGSALTQQNIALLKQTPLHLLKLAIDNQSVRIVTANTLVNALSTKQSIPIVKSENGWQIPNQQQLNATLQQAAAQVLKQNLPQQTSILPLLKIARLIGQTENTPLANLPKTRTQLQSLNQHVFDAQNAQNPKLLAQVIKRNSQNPPLLNQLQHIQQVFTQESISQLRKPTALPKALITIEQSLSQLQQTLNTQQTTNHTTLKPIINSLQNLLQSLSHQSQGIFNVNTKLANEINQTIQQLIVSIQQQGSQSQENWQTIVHQQLNSLSQAINQLFNQSLTSPANQALLQLLGVTLHSQRQDQNPLQIKIQQQLKLLIQQSTAKLQINQLRNLGLDSTKEPNVGLVQQHHGELALRFNEQILPLTYQIQGFAEDQQEHSAQQTTDKNNEKTRRWQIFLSLDLPNQEILHCKMTIIDQTIDTTLWAESNKLCRTTENALDDLRNRFTQAGLKVNQLQCFEGMPPQDETSISYHLVDITT